MTKDQINLETVARLFWQSRSTYPNYGFIKRRRFYEVSYILEKVSFKRIDKLVDLGCGDGGLVKCLDNFLDIGHIYCYDYSVSLMDNIYDPKIDKHLFDINDFAYYRNLPKCDLLVFGGVLNFMFDDRVAVHLLAHFDAEHIFIRCPCTQKPDDEVVNVFSDQLNSYYSSVYRTVKNTIRLIEQSGLTINQCVRIYPDDIESSFGTKQQMFYCTRKG